QWVYTITGSVGDTFQFSGWATSSTITSTIGTTDQGVITEYSVTLTPSTVTSGATGVSLNFEVFNNGALPLRQVTITTSPGWTYVGSSGPPGWSINVGGSPTEVQFRNATTPIPVGGSETFTIIYDVPSVGSPAEFNFLVEVWDTVTPYWWFPTGSLEVPVLVMPYEIVLTSSIPPPFPTPPVADGVQYYDLLATLNGPGGAISGAPITFTTTAGSLGNGTVVTDASGQAPNTLTGPLSNTLVSATVTAEYLGAFATTVLTFDPFTGVAMDYIPGSLSPVTVSPGDPAVIFSLTVINSGTWSVTLDTASTFSFSDTSAGGSSTYIANLNTSSPVTINPGSTGVLTFQAANVPAAFFTGDFFPALFLVDGGSSGTRPVSDSVKVLYYPDLVVLKSSSVFSDPVNNTVNPKAIPMATVQYTILVTNTGLGWADSNTVRITDAVAANTELFVGDMGIAGSGPVIFSDGSPASGLTYNFTALGSPADDLEFSNNGGGSYIYSPVPDADGYDSAVTHFRVDPEGRLNASDGVNNPNFSIIFRVRIQ
ncbi:MAG: Ig-like domain-containing protein, partial [bacterium]